MVNCRGCGDELAPIANFCPKCGLRTEKGEEEGVKTPIGTRPGWEKDIETALNNATKLMEEAFDAARRGLQTAADEIGVEIEKAKTWRATKANPVYCPKCGKKNPNDALYCTTCGKELPQ
ncbi:MAG: zinc ribbon domain-containing protein [Candidatus Bathyarchaeota archaeon]|nr:zinc ribbon domain-containing protein [Candidatus Bathyarchaeota archaeon]